MHEFGYAEALRDVVERRAAGRPVLRVRVQAGVLHRLDQESLAQAFEMVAADGVAAGAEVDLVTVPLMVRCRACEARAQSQDPLPLCPSCGSADLDVSGGDVFVLESIELEPRGAAPCV
ncbi:MAG: hydrogenase maturation nickel metallochaperone HypA [Frankiaceae bacterium]